MWIARDRDGGLYLYSNAPRINYNKGWFMVKCGNCISVNSNLLPEVTFENSPIEVEVNYPRTKDSWASWAE